MSTKENDSNFISAFKDSLPVMAGYMVLGFGFGIIMNSQGYSAAVAPLMSLFIYAGSMQYAFVGLAGESASFLMLALTTLAVNARHLFYGISMVDKYKDAKLMKPYLIFGLTDETYSIVCNTDRNNKYCFFVTLLNHIYWVSGTLLGVIVGEKLSFNSKGVEFALTALFISVLTDQWLKNKNHFPAIAGILVSIICRLIFGASAFLIPTMVGIAAVLILGRKAVEKNDT